MSIKYLGSKINAFLKKKEGKDLLIVLIILLTSFASFGLGVLSERMGRGEPVHLLTESAAAGLSQEELNKEETVVVPNRDPGGYVVASKNGSKYHFPWCSGAQSIKEENKIWFNSIEEARAAGYLPASNCKGLE